MASEKRSSGDPDPERESASPARSITDASAKDEAIAMVGEQQHELDPALVRCVVRKIDWFLIPAMTFGYGLVYYDKAILGAAALFGMTTDLQLTVVDRTTTPPTVDTSRLSWATSLFYFGMLAGLYPMTFALQRFNMGRILGGVVVLWAGICMLTAAVTTYQGLYVQRFFLGFVESIIPTGFMCIITSYYTQREQTLRQGYWFSATCSFLIIGSALNYGFAQITGGSLHSWQYIYLLAGVLTFLFGLMCFAMPSAPMSAWFLSADEKFAAVERLREGQAGVRCTKLKLSQVRESLLDPKTYLIFVMMASAYTVNGAVSGFGPLIVSTFGWSALESILLQFPLGFIGLVAILLACYLAGRIPHIRILMLVVSCLPTIAGYILIWKSEWTYHAAAPIVGFTMIGFFGVPVTLTISLGMSNVAGNTKKSFMAATIFVAYCVGNIIGPQMVRSQTRAQHYPELWTGLIICYVICIVAAITLYMILARENKKRDAAPVNEEERAKLAFQDLTDMENPYFRYVY